VVWPVDIFGNYGGKRYFWTAQFNWEDRESLATPISRLDKKSIALTSSLAGGPTVVLLAPAETPQAPIDFTLLNSLIAA